MKIRTSHVFAIGVLGLVLSQGENIRAHLERSQVRGQEKQEHRDKLRRNRDELNQAAELSKLALKRAETCILVLDTATKQESYFVDLMPVIDAQALNRPIRDEVAICNSLGDTAIVKSGMATDIARVSTPDKAKFTEILTKQKE